MARFADGIGAMISSFTTETTVAVDDEVWYAEIKKLDPTFDLGGLLALVVAWKEHEGVLSVDAVNVLKDLEQYKLSFSEDPISSMVSIHFRSYTPPSEDFIKKYDDYIVHQEEDEHGVTLEFAVDFLMLSDINEYYRWILGNPIDIVHFYNNGTEISNCIPVSYALPSASVVKSSMPATPYMYNVFYVDAIRKLYPSFSLKKEYFKRVAMDRGKKDAEKMKLHTLPVGGVVMIIRNDILGVYDHSRTEEIEKHIKAIGFVKNPTGRSIEYYYNGPLRMDRMINAMIMSRWNGRPYQIGGGYVPTSITPKYLEI